MSAEDRDTHGATPCGTHKIYKMSCAEYDALAARAAGHCEACGIPAEEAGIKRLVIDHDHRYGLEAVRGLICSACNTLLSTIEHTKPVGNYNSHPQFGEYLEKSWFLQMLRFGRLISPQMTLDNPHHGLVEAVLRSRFVMPLTRAMGQQPKVQISKVVTPGPLRYRAKIRHMSADSTHLESETIIIGSTATNFELESVRTMQWDNHRHFDEVTKAATYVRQTRKHWEDIRKENVANQLRKQAEWEAEREARKSRPSPDLVARAQASFGDKPFSTRDLAEAAGCEFHTAHRAVKQMRDSGLLESAGRGPKVSNMGRAPEVWRLLPTQRATG